MSAKNFFLAGEEAYSDNQTGLFTEQLA